jgi:MFS family permease
MMGGAGTEADVTLPRANCALAVLAGCWLMAYLDRAVIALLATSIKHSLNVTDVEIGVLQGIAFSVVYIVVALPVGWLADRANRRNIILFGVCIWSLATIACGLARSYHELALSRMMMGFGEACLTPASMSMIADYFARTARGRAIGVVTGAATLGSVLSSLIGGGILKICGGAAVAIPLIGLAEPWQITFIALGAPGFLIALLLLTVREPSRRQAPKKAMPVETSAGSFARVLARRWRVFLPIYLALMFSVFAGYGSAAWMATVAIRRYALSPAYVGLVGGSVGLVMGTLAPVVVGMVSDWAGGRWPRTGRLWTIAVLFTAQIPLIAGWAFLPVPFAIFLALSTLNGVAGAGLPSTGYILLQELVPNHMRAQAVALFVTISSFIGMGFGPVVIALVTEDVFHDEMKIGYAVAAVSLICVVLGLFATLSAIGSVRSLAGRDDGSGDPAGQPA